MPRHDRMRFYVEAKVIRRPVDPVPRHFWRKQRVIGRIHFDEREMMGVVLESRFGAARSARIKCAALNQGLVGPARGAETHVFGLGWFTSLLGERRRFAIALRVGLGDGQIYRFARPLRAHGPRARTIRSASARTVSGLE